MGIKSLREFIETFMYYFQNEANAEVVVTNNDMFKEVLEIVRQHVEYDHFLGGHSAVFCQRAQLEGCRCFMSPVRNQFNLSHLKVTPQLAERYLKIRPGSEPYDF